MKTRNILALVIAIMMIMSCFTVGFAAEMPEMPEPTPRSEQEPSAQLLRQVALEEVANKNLEEVIPIIVELVEEPLLAQPGAATMGAERFLETQTAQSLRKSLISTQEVVKSQIQKIAGADTTFKYSFVNTLNGFSTEVAGKNIEAIRNLAAVKEIYLDTVYNAPEDMTPNMTTSNTMIGSQIAWNVNYKGEGMLVAVIDTGFDHEHEAMVVSPDTLVKLDEAKVEEILASKTLNAETYMAKLKVPVDVTAADVYKNNKFPFTFDYADSDFITTPDVADKKTGELNEHGVHVAGTVAANAEAAVRYYQRELSYPMQVMGVAPESQILGMKVFSATGGAKTSNTIAAIEDAIALGADAINLSLGSPAGFTFYQGLDLKPYEYEYSFRKAREAGIVIAASAGNENRIGEGDQSFWAKAIEDSRPVVENVDTALVGSPSTKYSATSVASVENVYINKAYFLYGNRKMGYSDTSETYVGKSFAEALDGMTVEFVNCGLGRLPGDSDANPKADDFANLDLTGKIAIMERGESSFYMKANNAATRGAIGAIIYNSEGNAGIINLNLTGVTTDMPVISITRQDGLRILNGEITELTFGTDLIGLFENPNSFEMSDFTSWGVTPDLELKPEITAPGGMILSTLTNDRYGTYSGTSMAAPHIAGAIAIVKQYVNATYPNLTEKEKSELVEDLMMSTATIVQDVENHVPYSPRRQGAGMVNLEGAVKSGAYLYNSETGKAKVELGEIGDKVEFTFDIVNKAKYTRKYEITGTMLTDAYEIVKIRSGNEIISQAFIENFARALEESTMTYNGVNINGLENNKYTGEKLPVISVGAGKTAQVKITMELDFIEKMELEEVFTNGFFIDGFVELRAMGKYADLSIPFVGFHGDWNGPKVFDGSMYYDDLGEFYYTNSYAYAYEYLIPAWKFYPISYVPLGLNGDNTVGNRKWIAISPNDDGYKDEMGMRVNLMRNAKDISINVYDVAGNLVKNVLDDIYYQKSYFYASGGYITTWDSDLWDGTDDEDEIVEDGQYFYEISAILDYNGASKSPQVLRTPVLVDTEAPVIESIEIDQENKTVTVKASDNHLLSIAGVLDSANEVVGDVEAYIDRDPVKADTYVFDLSESEDTEFYIVVGDMAGNDTVELIEILPTFNYKLTYTPNFDTDLEPFDDEENQEPTTVRPARYTLDECPWEREGFEFIGWSRTAEGGKLLEVGSTIALDGILNPEVVLYAQWQEVQPTTYKYTLTYMPNFDTQLQSFIDQEHQDETTEKSVEFTLDGNTWYREGYNFVGWSKDAEGSEVLKVGDKLTVVGAENPDAVVYAVWEAKANGNGTTTPVVPNPGTTPVNPNPGTTPVNPNPGTPGNPNPGTPIADEEVPGSQLPQIMFIDIDGHWAENTIIAMAMRKIAAGYPDNTFRPNNTLTAEQFVTFVVRALGYEDTDSRFDTVYPTNQWSRPYVELAKELGFIDDNFVGNEPMTREEMAKVVALALAHKKNVEVSFEGEIAFTDVDASSEYAEFIGFAVENDLLHGHGNGTFGPSSNLTRAQAVTVIENLLAQINK